VISWAILGEPAHAAILYTGGTYTQNFDSLSSTTGSDLTWTNNSTLPGWSLFRQPSPGTALTTYRASTGSDNTGSFYSFGSSGSSERALGGVGSGGTYYGSPTSGAIAGWIAFAITNDTAGAFDSFTIGYDGEQWRNGGNTTQHTMTVEYGFGTTFDTVASWTALGAGFDFTGPIATSTAGLLDGNAAANQVTGLGGTVTANWAPGDTLWIRFTERNDAGNDHGLAIDNFSFSATAAPIPEPSSLALLGIGLAALAAYRRRGNQPAAI
jgi:hypothetical protein